MIQRDMHMVHPNDIPKMEAALAARGISVSAMCRKASVAETTWGRWKRGEVSPTFKTWDAVSTAYSEILRAKKQGAA